MNEINDAVTDAAVLSRIAAALERCAAALERANAPYTVPMPAQPYVQPNGYTCASCGSWIGYGTGHICHSWIGSSDSTASL